MPLAYLILMVWLTLARHEGAHALAAWLQGVPVYRIRLFPGYSEQLGLYFGYVSRGSGGSWIIDAAPFIAALLWFLAGFSLLRRIPRHSPWWLPLFFVGMISPLVDLAYNYQGGFWRQGTDVWDLFQSLPDPVVHAYFLGALLLFSVGIARVRSTG